MYEEIETSNGIRTYKYDSHVKPRLKEIYEWVRDGCTDYSIAGNLGICHESLIKYKAEILELSSVYVRARAEYNRLTYNSMHKKANGITVEIKKQKVLNDGSVISFTEEQYIPPDVNAADLDLRNHDPDYKGPKAETGLTLIQNNYQLPEAKAEIARLLEEYRQLERLEAVDVEVMESE
jgi:DNA-binding CsgD family transcriptional regulator